MAANEGEILQRLQELQKQLSKKQMFEGSVSEIKSLLQQHYSSASPNLHKSFYTVVCRVATVLKARYTSPGYWNAGLSLFQEAEHLVSDASERNHLQTCIAQARDQLCEVENQPEVPIPRERGYLFEGHLTVDPEPNPPAWLIRSQLMAAAAAMAEAETPGDRMESANSGQSAASLLQDLVDNLDDFLPAIMGRPEAGGSVVPPASKEVVANLPVMSVTEEVLVKLGKDASCSICQESLNVDDKMQELPCKHMFHPPCLKPWLDQHNSCPICRHELKTDDHAYESWKEKEKEREEERKGAANAVRGGEYMYV